MNKLEELKKNLGELVKTITKYQATAPANETEVQEFKSAIDEAKTLKTQITELEGQAKDAGEIISFAKSSSTPAPIVPTGGTPATPAATNKSAGEDVYAVRKDGSFGLAYTDDPLFGNEALMKEFASTEYQKCFALIAKGGERDPYRLLDKDQIKFVEDMRRKAASVGIEEDGGFLVPPQMVNEIVRQRAGQTSVSQMVRRQPTTSAAIQMLRYEDSGSDTYTNTGLRIAWTGEGADPNDQNQPKLKPFTIPVHEGEVEVALTRTFLEDAPGAVNSYIGEEFRTSFDLGVEDVILNGNGIAKPTGILARVGEVYGPAAVNVGNPVTADGLIDAYYTLPAQYRRNNSRIVMRDSVFGDLQKLKDGANNYIFGVQANFDGLALNAQERLRGTPIMFTDFTEDSGSAKKIAIHGDFSTYMMVVRLGMTMRMRDIPGQQPAAVFRFRFGGDLLMGRGMKVWTQS